MDMTLELSAAAMGVVPLVMLITSYAKNYVEAKWSPIVAFGLSLLASFFLVSAGGIVENVVQGLLLSLVASGLYSGGKSLGKSV